MLSVLMLIEDKLINFSFSKNNPVLPYQTYMISLVITIFLCLYQEQCLVCIYDYKREMDQCI
jgi:hypothetical protein